MLKKLFCSFFLFSFFYSQAQMTIEHKTVNALRISKSPIIDGKLDDDAWINVEPAKDFVMFQPGDGGEERENKKTTVKIIYDNEAIYFGATMYDDTPKEIPMQFGGRDDFGQVDFFLISINPNNDGQNDTLFMVASTGAQGDAKPSFGQQNLDFNWNAVWDSDVSVNDKSWVVEVKIPYSVLRFSNSNVQTWGINFIRKLNNLNEEYVWNYIDKKTGVFSQYSGNLVGIENINPPIRLNFSPYASTSYTSYNGDSNFEKSIGLDLKYGINESFTLDATLIPDFGQTAFDEEVLNLGPFEQRYEEKRSFFTEGTELFSKGMLFYSRRIGNAPVEYDAIEENLGSNEEIIDNPSKVNMLNAIKLSGRTKGGLGIGIFNAITEKTSAKIKNLTTEEIKTIVTEPLANYSVLVLDQQFNKNSSISLINTNVLRDGKFRDANVTAFLFNISDKENKFNVSGNVKMSNILENGEKQNGYAGYLDLSKIKGNIQYSIKHFRSNENYDIKDLGFQRRNNYANYNSEISYRTFEPTKYFNAYRIKLEGSLRYQNTPNKYAGNDLEFRSFFVTKNKFAFGFGAETNIGSQYDFYEPRVAGRFFKQNAVLQTSAWFSTDYRRKFAIDVRGEYARRYGKNGQFHSLNISPRYRFTDKFQIIYDLDFSELKNENGWVNELENGAIIFGNRDVKAITNALSGKLSFNTKSSLALSFRHYWSPVNYDSTFYELNNEGTLDQSTYFEDHNINFNIWNLDLNYSWQFAPGSQLIALYRNAIFNEDNLSQLNFKNNLDNLFKEPVMNNFSLKFIYFLDYNNLKTWL